MAKKTPAKKEVRNAGHAISRMPRAVRDKVSHCLEDGGDWHDVAKICKAAGFAGVRAQNVTNYRKGWHQEWLTKQERLEAIRRDSDATAEVMEHYTANGGSPAECGLLASAEIMSKALMGMGPEALQILIADDPKALFGITRELARIAELITKKSQVAVSAPSAEKETMTPEERTKAMKEIFGLPG